ncbi:MAG TPA: outer membrane protein assembly factor BamA, partial [Candidatus Polarisedimenticolia bacterium]|nr:outer membrane protein assembly factor BamA [Candidatus Polarisedimenticolia bacterium]
DLTADLAAGGTTGELSGPVAASSGRLEAGGLAFEQVSARGALDGRGGLRLDELAASVLGGSLSASGSIPLGRGAPAPPLDVLIEGIDLAALQGSFGGPAMAGKATVRGVVTPAAPVGLEGTLQGTAVVLAGLDLGQLTGTFAGTLDRLRVEAADAGGVLSAAGELLDLAGDGTPSIEAQLQVRGFSLEEVRPLLPPGALEGLRGEADAAVFVRGPLGALGDLEVRARIDRLHLVAGEYPLRNEEPLFLTLLDNFLTLAPARLTGDRTDLVLGGSMVLGGSYEATLRLEGTFDLGLVEVLSPEMRASGPGTVDIRIVERGDVIAYSGTLSLDGGAMAHPSLPQPLENIRGSGRFVEGGRFELDALTFDTGGGHVTGAGHALFSGASVPEMRLELDGRGIRSEIFPSLRAFFDADVTLEKQGTDYSFAGAVRILRAIYSRPFGIEPAGLLLRNREFGPAPERTGPPVTVLLDLHIMAEQDLWIRNDDALIEAAANLTLTGTLAEPELYGRIAALEGGTYRFRDVTYRIQGGSLDFADVARIDPQLDIKASTRVQQYDVTLQITGRFSRPVYELTSDPPLPQSDIVWLLVTGRTLTESGNEASRAAAEGQVAAYLAAPVAGAVTEPLEKLLGVSSVQIDPFFLNGTADPTARVTVTKRVAENLLFTYSSSLGQSGQEVYQIEYNPGRLWDVLGTRDLDGSVGADVRIRRRWHGWGWSPEASRPPVPPGFQAAEPASELRIGAVRIVADRLVEKEESLRRRLPFGAGDPLNRGDLLEGRETLRQHYVEHGFPAASVDVVESDPTAREPEVRDVTYTIRAGVSHDVAIVGDVRRAALRRAVREAWQEPILLEDIQEEAREAALEALKEQGRYAAQVTARTEPTAEGKRIVLEAVPGPKVKVRSVTVQGDREMPEDRILRQMLTRPGGWLGLLGRGLLKESVLVEDRASIRALYLANGYLDVEVAPPAITLSGDQAEADITVTIEEGPQYLVGAVVVEGAAPGVEDAELVEAADLSTGQNLTEQVVSAAMDRLRTLLDRHGYTQARVTHRIEGRPERTQVIFSVSPGGRERIARVTFAGNVRTSDRTIHREITLDAGDHLTRAGVLETQRNLYRLGVFRSVEVRTTPAGEPGQVNVHLQLVEGAPILTAWGVGYDSEDGARASFELADNNLFGTRRSAGVFLRASAVDRRVQFTLRDPNLFGEKIETLFTGFLERQDTDSFTARRLGAIAQLSRKISDHTTLYGRYRLEDLDLFDLKVSAEEAGQQTVRLGNVGLSIARDTRNDIVNPSDGGLTSFDVRFYGPIWGSEEQFTKVFASATRFQDIGRKVVWASSVRAGLISSRGIPISERFFAGGDTTLRGFEYNTAGPADADTGEPTGGEGIFLFNQELRFPLYSALTGVVFYDAGNVFSDFTDYDLGDLRHVGGVGLRLSTPVGPFRIEYGRKLDRERGESRGEIFFSIGQAF